MRHRGVTAQGEQRRQAILEAALDVFAECGYDGVSLNEVAVRAGLTQAGVLYYFPSKKDLFTKTLQYRDDVAAGDIDVESGVGAVELLRSLPDLAARNQEDPRLLHLFIRAAADAANPDHPAHAWGAQRYERAFAWYRQAFERDQQAGTIRTDLDTGTLARQLIAALDGINTQWFIADKGFDKVALTREVADAMLARILPA